MNAAYSSAERLTIAEFEQLPEENEYLQELVRGFVVREPRPAYGHGRLQVRVASLLDRFVRSHNLGVILVETGFVLATEPPTVRGPDVSFIATERLPMDPQVVFPAQPPDLAVEILSPSNTASDIHEKVLDYLAAGVRLIWVVDPRTRSVAVHSGEAPTTIAREGEFLDGRDVVPGLTLEVADLFE
jgi:Uma2 family endonuclease